MSRGDGVTILGKVSHSKSGIEHQLEEYAGIFNSCEILSYSGERIIKELE